MNGDGRGRFTGHTVVITGASRGLGRAIARAFAAEGAFVHVGFHARVGEAEATLAALREAGGAGALLDLDVRDARAVEHAMASVVQAHGRLDVLVNNAGQCDDALLASMTDAAWRDVLAVDLDGVFHCCRAAARHMVGARRGAIVNVASTAAIAPSPGQANYSAAKAGAVALGRTLAAELGRYGVRVNAVLPGLLDTGMGARLDRRVAERARAGVALGRLGTAEEVARAVLFLASSDASYVTGQALVVDGGRAT